MKQVQKGSLRVGIIGCGGIAAAHVNGYQKNNIKITALTDLNKSAAEAAAGKIEGESAVCFEDYTALLDSGLVDAVSICTPPVAHEAPAVAALSRNIHVLSEKPLAHNVEAGKKIVAASEKSDAVLMTAFRHRFLPANLKIKELITAGEIGDPVFFQNIFCGPAFFMKDKWFSKKDVAGGGTLMDTSIHSVDLFRFFMGEVVEQKAVMHRHLEGTDVEDTSILVLKAENGVVGSLTSSWVAGDGMAFIDITGQNGRVVFDYGKSGEIRVKKRDEKEWNIVPVTSSNGFAEQIRHFVNVIHGEEAFACTGYDGLRALEIVCSNYK